MVQTIRVLASWIIQERRCKGVVRREPISKSCEKTQADNLNRRRRLSRKAQGLEIEVGKIIKIFVT